MKISGIKICGLEKPLGYSFDTVTVSWRVEDSSSPRQKETTVSIAADKSMENILFEKTGVLPSCGVTCDISFAPRTQYFVRVAVTGEDGERAEGCSCFETGMADEPWAAKWIGVTQDCEYHPVLSKAFTSEKKPARARLYITGVGLYSAELNGEKVGSDVLAPFFNDYSSAIQVQTYDVTELIRKENTLSISLGNGWYKGRLGYEGGVGVYGKQFAAIAQLHIDYTDGTQETVVTDESWQAYAGDTTYSDIYDGEGCDRMRFKAQRPSIPLVLPDMSSKKLCDRYSMPLREMDTLSVKEVITTPAGETVLDFGQNFSGYVSFRAHGLTPGTTVTLEHGEVLQNGNFYHDNYRSAKTLITYISDGRDEWFTPRFTYMGFRYVKLSGWPGELNIEDFKGIAVYSAMDRTGWLETGHEKVNKLISNALWGLKSNFLDMPTDCPQRDERLGWTGDAQVFAPTACFFMDTRAFYRKYFWDMRCDQVKNGGAVAHYLPNINNETGGAAVWADAAAFMPEAVFDAFGDLGLLREFYPLMRDWVEWVTEADKRRGQTYLFDFHFTFGDWLAMDGVTEQSMKGGTEDAYVSSVYYYASTKKLARAAGLLGLDADAKKYGELAENIREAVLREYFAPSGRLAADTQTAYIIALYFGIWRDKQVLQEGLRSRLKRDGNRIRCGFAGAPLICLTLAENGMDDLAMHLFLQEKFPSWLHCVNLGATTIWERWNSLLDDGSISGTGMNSLNHYSYGSVINYAVRHIAGLTPLEPGYRRVRIAPKPDARLGRAALRYRSASGEYAVSWEIDEKGGLKVHCEVPFDCEAELLLPGSEETLVLSCGSHDFTVNVGRDLRSLYGMDTMLDEVSADSRALDILREELPAAFGMAMSGDIEALSMTFRDLKLQPWFGCSAEAVDKAVLRLSDIKIN